MRLPYGIAENIERLRQIDHALTEFDLDVDKLSPRARSKLYQIVVERTDIGGVKPPVGGKRKRKHQAPPSAVATRTVATSSITPSSAPFSFTLLPLERVAPASSQPAHPSASVDSSVSQPSPCSAPPSTAFTTLEGSSGTLDHAKIPSDSDADQSPLIAGESSISSPPSQQRQQPSTVPRTTASSRNFSSQDNLQSQDATEDRDDDDMPSLIPIHDAFQGSAQTSSPIQPTPIPVHAPTETPFSQDHDTDDNIPSSTSITTQNPAVNSSTSIITSAQSINEDDDDMPALISISQTVRVASGSGPTGAQAVNHDDHDDDMPPLIPISTASAPISASAAASTASTSAPIASNVSTPSTSSHPDDMPGLVSLTQTGGYQSKTTASRPPQLRPSWIPASLQFQLSSTLYPQDLPRTGVKSLPSQLSIRNIGIYPDPAARIILQTHEDLRPPPSHYIRPTLVEPTKPSLSLLPADILHSIAFFLVDPPYRDIHFNLQPTYPTKEIIALSSTSRFFFDELRPEMWRCVRVRGDSESRKLLRWIVESEREKGPEGSIGRFIRYGSVSVFLDDQQHYRRTATDHARFILV